MTDEAVMQALGPPFDLAEHHVKMLKCSWIFFSSVAILAQGLTRFRWGIVCGLEVSEAFLAPCWHWPEEAAVQFRPYGDTPAQPSFRIVTAVHVLRVVTC